MTKAATAGALAAVILAASGTSLVAAPMKISADMNASSETPPNDSQAKGTLTGTYDPDTKMLTYNATYSGLTGPATMAHFHAPAPAGKAAGVEIPVKGSVESPIKGEAKLTDEQAKNLTDGQTYFNVHTDKNKKGEIRGQVMVAQ